MRYLLTQAYDIRFYQISAAPDWITSEMYDVEAKMDPDTADALKAMNPEQRKLAQQQMLQAVLTERLALKFHNETKEQTVYFLTVAKSGSKLPPSKPTAENNQLIGPDGSGVSGYVAVGRPAVTGDRKYIAYAVSMSYFVRLLSTELRRPVLDKTGLTGTYDFSFEYLSDVAHSPTPDSESATPIAADPGGASIFTAIQQQLGLKLQSGKGPIEMFVIDHVERPAAN